jgi:hypothetical protein
MMQQAKQWFTPALAMTVSVVRPLRYRQRPLLQKRLCHDRPEGTQLPI